MLAKVDFTSNVSEELDLSVTEQFGMVVTTFTVNNKHESFEGLKNEDGTPFSFDVIQEESNGVFWGDLNFDNMLSNYSDKKLLSRFPNFVLETGEYFEDSTISMMINSGRRLPEYVDAYGVADNIEQVFERFDKVINNPNYEVVISAAMMYKGEQPNSNGWRWHKWGEYIGTQEPKCEYLADEENIDEVLVFHIFVVGDKE